MLDEDGLTYGESLDSPSNLSMFIYYESHQVDRSETPRDSGGPRGERPRSGLPVYMGLHVACARRRQDGVVAHTDSAASSPSTSTPANEAAANARTEADLCRSTNAADLPSAGRAAAANGVSCEPDEAEAAGDDNAARAPAPPSPPPSPSHSPPPSPAPLPAPPCRSPAARSAPGAAADAAQASAQRETWRECARNAHATPTNLVEITAARVAPVGKRFKCKRFCEERILWLRLQALLR